LDRIVDSVIAQYGGTVVRRRLHAMGDNRGDHRDIEVQFPDTPGFDFYGYSAKLKSLLKWQYQGTEFRGASAP
jgi:hypothetical protein